MKNIHKMVLCSAVLLSSRNMHAMNHDTAGGSGDEKKKALCAVAQTVDHSAAVSSTDADCPICSDSLSSGGEVADSEGLPFVCHHPNYRYHDACMARWIERCKKEGLPITCPFCRKGLRKLPSLVQAALAEDPVAPAGHAPAPALCTSIFNAEQLVKAARNNDPKKLLACLAHGVNVNAHNRNRATALTWAVVNGNVTIMRILLDQPNIRIDEPFTYGGHYLTALCYAIKNGDKTVAKMLLNHQGF